MRCPTARIALILTHLLRSWSQRAPCYQCEMYKDTHPNSNPFAEIRGQCVYPCKCSQPPKCPSGIPLALDGCQCCWKCSRQEGESCDITTPCDISRGLTCLDDPDIKHSICKVFDTVKCQVGNKTYDHGQIFFLDCRTKCSCQNGTYACVSLCPSENIQPSAMCHNPKLITIPGQCCRDWMCDVDSDINSEPAKCNMQMGRWSKCSASFCGVGISTRWTTDSVTCKIVNETRLCQIRPCGVDFSDTELQVWKVSQQGHHVRRGRRCKATMRYTSPVRLRMGPCISQGVFKPKQCGDCEGRCCRVHSSTTMPIAFLCPPHAAPRIFEKEDSRTPEGFRTLSAIDKMDESQTEKNGVHDFGKEEEEKFQTNLMTDEVQDEYDRILSTGYELLRQKVEWIIRCSCESSCKEDFDHVT